MTVKTIKQAEEEAARERQRAFTEPPVTPRLTFLMSEVRKLCPGYENFTELNFFENAVGDEEQGRRNYQEALRSGGQCLSTLGYLEEKIAGANKRDADTSGTSKEAQKLEAAEGLRRMFKRFPPKSKHKSRPKK